MRRWRHRIIVSEPGVGVRDPVTGAWVKGPDTILYEGYADVQDEPVVLARDLTGAPTLTADGTITLPVRRGNEEQLVRDLKGGHRVEDHFRGEVRDAEIVRVLRMSAQLNVKFA